VFPASRAGHSITGFGFAIRAQYFGAGNLPAGIGNQSCERIIPMAAGEVERRPFNHKRSNACTNDQKSW